VKEKPPDQKEVPPKTWKVFIVLHLILLLYSIAAILSKTAAGVDFISLPFILCYGGVLVLLLIYALVWQWVLKSLPLTIAYANKGVTIIWGMVWGFLLFDEAISVTMLIGAAIVFAGIMLVVTDHG
jgi:drug/metabolite transporter (DMT)-like permease